VAGVAAGGGATGAMSSSSSNSSSNLNGSGAPTFHLVAFPAKVSSSPGGVVNMCSYV
jgi:hypothetical protein